MTQLQYSSLFFYEESINLYMLCLVMLHKIVANVDRWLAITP
jgi:hypothetical protein